jgi:hypothetical protein
VGDVDMRGLRRLMAQSLGHCGDSAASSSRGWALQPWAARGSARLVFCSSGERFTTQPR